MNPDNTQGDVSALNVVLGLMFVVPEDKDEMMNSTVESSDEENDYLKVIRPLNSRFLTTVVSTIVVYSNSFYFPEEFHFCDFCC